MELNPFTNLFIYAAGAVATLVLVTLWYRPKAWLVDLVPENTIETGDTILVPVGNAANCRLMRVLSKRSDTQCKAVDLLDHQHYKAVAIGVGVGWPILLPIVIAGSILTSLANMRHQQIAVVQRKPKETMHNATVPVCMREYKN